MANDDLLEFPEFSDNPSPKPTQSAPSVQRTVHSEQRVETASEDEINSQLASLTKRTTIEELAKRGKTKNLKTLSERNLKQWIHEALRRVISSSTTIDSAEADRLLANTRKELTGIMEERQAEANNRAADARKLAELTAQQQSMGRRIAELEQSLADAEAEKLRLADQIQDLDADLASKEYSSSNDAINALRNELAAVKNKHATTLEEQGQLRKNLGRQLVASTEVVTALLAIDQRFYNARHHAAHAHLDEDGTDTDEAFFADQNTAAAVAAQLSSDLGRIDQRLQELVPAVSEGDDGALAADHERLERVIWKQEHDEVVSDLQHQLTAAQAAATADADSALKEDLARLQDELDDAEITAEAYEQRISELADALAERDAQVAEMHQQLAAIPDTTAVAEDDDALFEAQAKVSGLQEELDRLRKEYEQAQKDNIILNGTLASLRRQLQRAQESLNKASAPSAELEPLRTALAAAESRAGTQQQRADLLNDEINDVRKALNAAESRAQQDAQRAAEAEEEVAKLRSDLAASASIPDRSDEIDALQEQLRSTEARAHNDAVRAADAEQEVARLRNQLTAASNDPAAALLQERNAVLEQQQGAQASEIDALRSQLSEQEKQLAENAALREQLARLQSQGGESAALKKRIQELEQALAAAPATTPENEDFARLDRSLQRARAMVTTGEGAPYEDICGSLVPRKPGQWLRIWRDPKGRLKTARTSGDRWVQVGKNKDHPQPEGLFGEPAVIVRGDQAYALWRDIDGQGHWAPLDKNGRLDGPPASLGPALGTPGISRGGGEAAPFVVTTDPVGHIHLDNLDGSPTLDMHRLLDIPPAAGPACCWHWGLEGSRHVAYRDHDGNIQELLELKGIWYHANLSEQTGAPAAVNDPQGYAPADHEHVIYLGLDGHVHELCFDGHTWHHHDLTANSVGAPAASGAPHGAYVQGRHCVVYRGVDGHAHCLRLRRDWRYTSMEALGLLGPNLSFSSCGNEGAILFDCGDGVLRWARFSDNPEQLSIEEV